jgi:hypothetical protein
MRKLLILGYEAGKVLEVNVVRRLRRRAGGEGIWNQGTRLTPEPLKRPEYKDNDCTFRGLQYKNGALADALGIIDLNR